MIIAADNLRITLPPIASAVAQSAPAAIRETALRCRDAGARAIDINSGPLGRDPAAGMTFLVRTVQEAVDLPLIRNTTGLAAVAAGLAACKRRAVINGVSLERRRREGFLPLARQYDADIVGYLLGPDGHVPADAAGRMEAAVALFNECERAGIAPERLIIDPVVAPLVWQDGNRQNMAVLEVIRTLPDLLGFPVRSIAGLSNLTTGAPDADTRRRFQCAFLPMLAAAGLDVILMNVLDPSVMQIAEDCGRIAAGTIFTWR
jgi:5-methyltetrahydrofolate corrinoid/iron sulfur protein methyltransferase